MKEMYLQNYLVENYTLIAMVVGTYFVVSMKSAVDIFIKKRMVINMTLLLILSIAEFYMNYLKDQAMIGLSFIIIGIIYYSLKPLVMAIVINIVEPKNKLIYIPVIINFFFYCYAFLKNKVFYFGVEGNIELGLWGYAFIVTNWVYWIIFLLVLNLKFYKNTDVNHLQAFFCIAWLMTANIMESIGVRQGYLMKRML